MWVKAEAPTEYRRITVLDWMFTRYANPYGDLEQQRDMPEYWFGAIPRTRASDGTMVVCTLRIVEQTRIVVCSMLGSLSPPYMS